MPGVRLHLRRTNAFKTIRAQLVLHASLDGDAAARALVPRVLARGTRSLPSLRALQEELDTRFGASLSGDARKMGERQLVVFRADWIHDRLAGAPLTRSMGDLLRELLHEPAPGPDGGLREEIVLQERKRLADEAAAVFDDKARYARMRLFEEMCRGEAYARPSIGRLEEIRAVEPPAVERAWRDLLRRAPADLFLVGDLAWRDATAFLGRLGFAPARPPRLPKPRPRRPARVRTVQEVEDVGQAKLAMGFRTRIPLSDPRSPALAVMNALYGGTPIGKLFKNVREKASLCYAVGSTLERTKGLLVVQAGIDAANYPRARRMIVAQLDALREGRIGDDEHAQARAILQSALHAMRDSPARLVDFALERVVNGVAPDLDGLVARLGSVEKRDVARAARAVELDTVYLLRNR